MESRYTVSVQGCGLASWYRVALKGGGGLLRRHLFPILSYGFASEGITGAQADAGTYADGMVMSVIYGKIKHRNERNVDIRVEQSKALPIGNYCLTITIFVNRNATFLAQLYLQGTMPGIST